MDHRRPERVGEPARERRLARAREPVDRDQPDLPRAAAARPARAPRARRRSAVAGGRSTGRSWTTTRCARGARCHDGAVPDRPDAPGNAVRRGRRRRARREHRPDGRQRHGAGDRAPTSREDAQVPRDRAPAGRRRRGRDHGRDGRPRPRSLSAPGSTTCSWRTRCGWTRRAGTGCARSPIAPHSGSAWTRSRARRCWPAMPASATAEVLVEIDCGHHRTGVAPDQAGTVAAAATAAGLAGPWGVHVPGAQLRTGLDHGVRGRRRGSRARACRGGRPRGRHPGRRDQRRIHAERRGRRRRRSSPSCGQACTCSTTPSRSSSARAGRRTSHSGCRATVVSRSDQRVVLDSGSKVLGADRASWATGFGRLLDHLDATVVALSEHHATATFPAGVDPPAIGEVVRVIPNHVCNLVNLVDELVAVRDGREVGRLGGRRSRRDHLTRPRPTGSVRGWLVDPACATLVMSSARSRSARRTRSPMCPASEPATSPWSTRSAVSRPA